MSIEVNMVKFGAAAWSLQWTAEVNKWKILIDKSEGFLKYQKLIHFWNPICESKSLQFSSTQHQELNFFSCVAQIICYLQIDYNFQAHLCNGQYNTAKLFLKKEKKRKYSTKIERLLFV